MKNNMALWFCRFLIDRNVSSQSIDKILEQEEEQMYSRMPSQQQQQQQQQLLVDSLQPHRDKTTWFVQCERREAERYLQGKPEGTFLIRPKEQDSYALSIVYVSLTIRELTHQMHCNASIRHFLTTVRCNASW